jgi:hypothetical protein
VKLESSFSDEEFEAQRNRTTQCYRSGRKQKGRKTMFLNFLSSSFLYQFPISAMPLHLLSSITPLPVE